MSHLHLPDGVLPLWLILTCNVLAVGIVAAFWLRKGEDDGERTRKFALLGIFAALMLLVNSIEVPGIFYHANLTVVTAIILRPRLAILAAIIVNIMLALFGHGGITMIGLNMLIYLLEMLCGYGIFLLCTRMRATVGLAGFLAVFLGLGLGTAGSFGAIALVTPAINAAISQGNFHMEEGHDEHEDEVVQAQPAPEEESHGHAPELLQRAVSDSQLNLGRLAALMFGLGLIGWLLEAILSSAMLTALQRTNPALLPGISTRDGS